MVLRGPPGGASPMYTVDSTAGAYERRISRQIHPPEFAAKKVRRDRGPGGDHPDGGGPGHVRGRRRPLGTRPDRSEACSGPPSGRRRTKDGIEVAPLPPRRIIGEPASVTPERHGIRGVGRAAPPAPRAPGTGLVAESSAHSLVSRERGADHGGVGEERPPPVGEESGAEDIPAGGARGQTFSQEGGRSTVVVAEVRAPVTGRKPSHRKVTKAHGVSAGSIVVRSGAHAAPRR